MDFSIPDDLRQLQQRVRRFLDDVVIPLERLESDETGFPVERLADLHRQAKAASVRAPQLPREYGGQGIETLGMCLLFEEAERSLLGPLALHCAAPDEGNMHLLLRAATPAQRERYLAPLARGETRSCFAMTEPAPGAGADPTMLRTRAERCGERWVINGHKWFTPGARGAAFAIVAAVTDPSVLAKQGVTLFLVDAGTPGFEMVRDVPTMMGAGQGGHCEVLFRNCEASDDQVLGGVGQGFKLMQVRLGPARLTHCMRWLGAAARSQEIATRYAVEREAFGKQLARQILKDARKTAATD